MSTSEIQHLGVALWSRHAPSSGYPPGVVPVVQPIPGVAFFPGGYGLSRAEPGKALPPMPVGGVMVLGHNFDDEANSARGHENLAGPTWRNLLHVLDSAGVPREWCFFTNFFMGVVAGTRSTGVFPGARDTAFVSHCRTFLVEQIRVQQPALVITLGVQVPRHISPLSPDLAGWADAKNLRLLDEAGPLKPRVTFDGLHRPTTVVALIHPSLRHGNLRWRRFAGYQGAEAERTMLRDAIEPSKIDLDRGV